MAKGVEDANRSPRGGLNIRNGNDGRSIARSIACRRLGLRARRGRRLGLGGGNLLCTSAATQRILNTLYYALPEDAIEVAVMVADTRLSSEEEKQYRPSMQPRSQFNHDGPPCTNLALI